MIRMKDEDNIESQDETSTKYKQQDGQFKFLGMLLRHVYSGDSLGETSRGNLARHFLIAKDSIKVVRQRIIPEFNCSIQPPD